MTDHAVRVERVTGSAVGFHDRPMPPFDRPEVWLFDVTAPAVALGSAQGRELVDLARAAAVGADLVRRRSGGGAVWLAPGEVIWLDVLLPADHPRWNADVSRSAIWLGRALADGLEAGAPELAGRLSVHSGPMQRGRWSDLVCFAGLAAGEVTCDGAKVVGISQRRTRVGARLQCAVLLRWDPRPLLDVLDLSPQARAEAEQDLVAVASGLGAVDLERLLGAVLGALTDLV